MLWLELLFSPRFLVPVNPVIIVTVMFLHSEITACDSDNKQSLTASYLI